ncbi:MAG: hypothetical protein QM488_12960 [Rhizobiaceae bacterium]
MCVPCKERTVSIDAIFHAIQIYQGAWKDVLLPFSDDFVAGCRACHTPRNLTGARKFDQRLQGAGDLPDGGSSPPITTTKLLAKRWTVSNLKYALRTGVRPGGDVFGGAMGEVVHKGTSFLNDNDLAAIAVHLLDKE